MDFGGYLNEGDRVVGAFGKVGRWDDLNGGIARGEYWKGFFGGAHGIRGEETERVAMC